MTIEQFINEIINFNESFILNYNGLDEFEGTNIKPIVELHSAVFTSVRKLRDNILSFSYYEAVGKDLYKGEPIDKVSMATGMSLFIEISKIERVEELTEEQYADLFEHNWSNKVYRVFFSNGDVVSLGLMY